MSELTLRSLQEEFAKGPVKVPLPVDADAYTVSGDTLLGPVARQRATYNLTNRIGPMRAFPGLALDNRMVAYGLTDFIQECLTKPVTMDDVRESARFMSRANSFGGGLYFPEHLWVRVVEEYNGYLPILIQGLPQGETFWPQEPYVQVRSLGEGFGEIAAIVEANLVGMVSCATARATMTRHLLERVRELVSTHNPTWPKDRVDGLASFFVHDFGKRASSTPAEARLYGRAHLLSFNGTDTFDAAYQAWKLGAPDPVGTSILALAHRIVQSWPQEKECYENLFKVLSEAGSAQAGSFVADCYDFKRAVREFLLPIAQRAKARVVARPDSGDYMDDCLFVVRLALHAGMFQLDEQGRPVSSWLSFIQGDSMTWQKICNVINVLDHEGVNPTRWGIFGIGGWLRNTPNRDKLSTAYKLSAMGSHDTPCVKLSSVIDKMSVPGPNRVCRPVEDGSPSVYFRSEQAEKLTFCEDRLVAYYDGAFKSDQAFRLPCLESFELHRNRARAGFDNYANISPLRGELGQSVLSPAIRKFQESQMTAHNRTK